MNKVFVDASVLFAGVISSAGYARDLLLRGQSNTLHLVCSTVVLTEVERNLYRKYPSALPTLAAFTRDSPCEIVDAPEELVHECARLVHPKDAPIVAAAAHAHADWLTTFDRQHLLRMRTRIAEHFAIAVAEPRDILVTLGLTDASG